ncbi:hypothetical protein MNBD_GAMMA10-2271 [hydrothermal vent metagenome]|uniref:Nucleotidyl transferase AbiEii/AbiGii toxin family protein n=1 Tax=hydrothermal vent metagenome TaxID=652676 RepID=A0A3B0Y3W0_9ZZZZ
MFNREHHKKILLILQSLNASVFDEAGAYFGGGTLISLLHDEYRWSKDVDFICPVGPGYRRLRELVADGMFKPALFFSKTALLEFPRDMVANQYGVRFLVIADGVPVKFEIVAESRLTLNIPDRFDWIPVPCLGFDDQCAEKLLANADRWLDTSVESRDLIDLAVLRLQREIPQAAIDKAELAYPVMTDLKRAVSQFQCSAKYRAKCFSALDIEVAPLIIDGIDLLARDFDMGKTERSMDE